MKNPSLLLIALCFLGVAMLGCLAGIIGLAWQGDRPIPDVLIGTTGTIVGAFGTLLVGTLGRSMDMPVRRRGDAGHVRPLPLLMAVLVGIGLFVLLLVATTPHL